MVIIVTGSNGIIGQQIIIQLLLEYPTAEFILINRHRRYWNNKRIKTVELNLIDQTLVQNELLFSKYKPDLLFHLSWVTEHANYLDALDNLKWERATINLINSFYQSGGKRFIGLGTSLEYDWNCNIPFNEKTSPVNGNNTLYGKSKLNVFNHLEAQKNISFIWGRVFFVFGPKQSKTRLIPTIVNNILYGGKPITINRNLKRDYISTFEIANQIILLQKSNYSGPVNICTGRSLKLGEIINFIEELSQKNATLSPITLKKNSEIKNISGDIDIIHKYFPKYNYSIDEFKSDLLKTIVEIKNEK